MVLITGRPTGAAPSPLPPKMSAGSLRVWFVFALRLGCVTPLAIPQDRGQRGRQPGLDSTMNTDEKRGALFHLSDLPRGPAVAPHKKAPQFMLDLFNAVSVSKSQKDILNGNIVRSFEDKGEEMQHLLTDWSHIFNETQYLTKQQHLMFSFLRCQHFQCVIEARTFTQSCTITRCERKQIMQNFLI